MVEGSSKARISQIRLQRLRLSELVARSDALRTSEFVALLPSPARDSVLDRAHLRRFEAGTLVYREGEEGCSLFLVLRGEAQLSAEAAQVAVCRVGDVFGEAELLRPGARSLSAHALSDLEVAEIERDWLTELGMAARPLGLRLDALMRERHKARHELDDFLKRW